MILPRDTRDILPHPPPPLPLPVCVHKFVCDATILCHVTTPPPWKPSPSFCGRNAAAGGLTMCKGEFSGAISHLGNPWRQPKRFSCKRGVGPLAASGGENTRVQFPIPRSPALPPKSGGNNGRPSFAPPSLPFWRGGGGPHRVVTFQFPPTRLPKIGLFRARWRGRSIFVSEPQPPTPTREGTAGPGAPVALGHCSPQRGNHCTCSYM